MRSLRNALPLFLVLLSLASCAAAPPVADREAQAITLSFEAEKMLNVRGGEPHLLALCVYQLRDPAAFKGLAESVKGLCTLLQCTPFDASVADARRVVVKPGTVRKVSLSRVDGSRFVGIVAGYYTPDRERVVRLYSIPMQTTGTVFVREEPLPLTIFIRLGPRGILPSRAEPAVGAEKASGAGT